MLLDHGSDPWIINKNGKKPVELANEDTIRDLLKNKQNERLGYNLPWSSSYSSYLIEGSLGNGTASRDKGWVSIIKQERNKESEHYHD
ncbi:hypothetical protein I862_06390 [endosymbiont of Acanthamoeba sp. UWC8]|uniref:hypothetical protein n=1 Tax=endosymbiont of Acanthamoeba sp. UWC8 TaxID=86106 RepID=UPI0004D1ACA0|nr:hypothetical protein [endosymbiont of Acanthamoeba sp. UWC8]AIF81832.1 hypothetical protein I862_06390 [endosymbiont of Acanthamoeba sp. UWC8]